VNFLIIPHGAGDDADRGLRITVLQNDLLSPFQLRRAAFAFGIVENNHEIRKGSGVQAFFDDLPRGQQITEADAGKIMGERGAQQRGAGADRRNSRHDFHLKGIRRYVRRCIGFQDRDAAGGTNLQCQPGHGIDSGITARYDGAGFPRKGFGDGGLDPVHFLGHGGADDPFSGNQRPDQIDVGGVSGHCFDRFQNLAGPVREMIRTAGPYTDDVKSIRAMARVTFGLIRLGTISSPLFDASMAAASHTLGTPM